MTENLTPRKRRALAALLTEPTVKAAADRVGVSRETIYRYMADAAFRAALSEAQADAMRVVSTRLAVLLGRSLDVVGDRLAGTDARLQGWASATFLRHVAGLAQWLDLEGRISELERRRNEGTRDTSATP